MAPTPARIARLLLVIAVLAGATAAAGSAATPGTARTARASGALLTGTWRGVLRGAVDGQARRERITIVVNSRQNAGTWKVSSTCYGRLTLDSISNGYHHYRRHLASGASCHGGDVDCLERDGANVADWVTPRSGGWARNGTLYRVRSG